MMTNKINNKSNLEKSRKVSFSIELSSISNNDSTCNKISNFKNTSPSSSSSFNTSIMKKNNIKNNKNSLDDSLTNQAKSSFLTNTSKFMFETNNLTLNTPIFAYSLNQKTKCQIIDKYNASLMAQSSLARTPNNQFNINDSSVRIHKNRKKSGEFVHKEGGFGWMVVIASCVCFGFVIAVSNSYSLIYNSLIQNYKKISSHHVVYAAWIGSFSLGIQFLTSIPASLLVEIIKPRKTALIGAFVSTIALLISAFITKIEYYFLTFGFLFGAGQSILMIATFAILPHYFKKKLGLANGLMNLGGSIITITMPILVKFCLNELDLRYTWFILASLSFLTFLFSFFFVPIWSDDDFDEDTDHKETIIATQTEEDNKSNLEIKIFNKRLCCIKANETLQIFKNHDFNRWCLASLFGLTGIIIPLMNITHHCEITFSTSRPELLNVIFASLSGLSALIFGKIGDLCKFSRIWFHFLSFTINGTIQLIVPNVKKFYELCLLYAILGICDGIYLSSLIPIVYEIGKTPKQSNQITGFYHSIIALPVISGPAVSALLFELNASYEYSFYLGGILCLFCSFILLLNPSNIIHLWYKLCSKTNQKNFGFGILYAYKMPYFCLCAFYEKNNTKKET